MRNWWKLLAAGLVSLGGMVSSASAQFPPPGSGGFGMPPGGGMVGPGPGMMPVSMGGPPPGAFNGGPVAGMPAEFPNPGQPSPEPAAPFSLKDEGMPNAFTCLHDPRPIDPARFQIYAGYSFLWFRGKSLPVMVTTGSLTDAFPGAIGQTNTRILDNGGRDPGFSSAFRVGATYWLLDPECLCIDANYFIMEQRSLFRNYSSDGSGNPLLARPFFNGTAGTEDANPLAIPFGSTGSLSDSMRTRLQGAEVNLKWYSANQSEGPNFSFFVGARWLRIEEQYTNNDTSTDIAFGGQSFNFSDTFSANNQFYGAQVGMEWLYRWGRANFGFVSKIAVGPIYQNIRLSGQTTVTDSTTQTSVTDFQQGFFVQPSNSGTFSNSQVAVLPEVGFKMNIDLSDRIRFNFGYNYFWLTHVAQVADQFDRRVNPQPLFSGGGNGPQLPPPPTAVRSSTFDVHSINLGLEFVF